MVFVFGVLSVWRYEYHYKDHLGNLRVAFQAKEDSEKERFSLTMEADSAQKEEAQFVNVAEARTDQKDKEGHYSAELENSKQAISKTIAVKKGDQIKASVFATHDPAIAETDPTKAIEEAKKDVLLSLGGVVAGSINTNPTQQEIIIPANPEITPVRTETIQTPKVQLNLLDFVPVIRNLRALNRAKNAKALEPDMYFVPKGELVLELRDSTDSLIFEKREKLTISSAVSWEKLVSDLEIKEDGNLKVYIDNSSSDKVYFDNFEIERTEATVAVVVQENHYYPFGMNMKGIEELDIQSIDGTDEHRFQYNGKEKEESFGLHWTDYGWRNMDVQLGRWHGIDGMAEKYISQSTYHYVGNNPVSNLDIDGNEFTDAMRQLVDKVIGELNSKIRYQENRVSNAENDISEIQNELATVEVGSKEAEKLERKLSNANGRLANRKSSLNKIVSISKEITSEFNALESSSQVYDFKQNNSLGNTGETGFDTATGSIVIGLSSSASVGLTAHELKHAYQFEIGSYSIGMRRPNRASSNIFYDKHDEVEAYERGAIFGESRYGLNNLPSTYANIATGPYSYQNIPEIQEAINGSDPQKRLQELANIFRHAFRVNGTTYYRK